MKGSILALFTQLTKLALTLIWVSGCTIPVQETVEYKSWLSRSEKVSHGRVYFDDVNIQTSRPILPLEIQPPIEPNLVIWFANGSVNPKKRSLEDLSLILANMAKGDTLALQGTAGGISDNAKKIGEARYEEIKHIVSAIKPDVKIYKIKYDPAEKGRRVLLWIIKPDDLKSLGRAGDSNAS